MTTPEIPEYINIAEVARRLQCSRNTVYKGIREGRIPGGIQITETCYRVKRAGFEAAMARLDNPEPAPKVTLLHTRRKDQPA